MYVVSNRTDILDDEPQLGSLVENELIIDKIEAYALIADAICNEGLLPIIVYGTDDYSDEDIELSVSDWIDSTTQEDIENWIEDLGGEAPDWNETMEKLEKGKKE